MQSSSQAQFYITKWIEHSGAWLVITGFERGIRGKDIIEIYVLNTSDVGNRIEFSNRIMIDAASGIYDDNDLVGAGKYEAERGIHLSINKSLLDQDLAEDARALLQYGWDQLQPIEVGRFRIEAAQYDMKQTLAEISACSLISAVREQLYLGYISTRSEAIFDS